MVNICIIFLGFVYMMPAARAVLRIANGCCSVRCDGWSRLIGIITPVTPDRGGLHTWCIGEIRSLVSSLVNEKRDSKYAGSVG